MQYRRMPGARLPSNVPYLIDNLWEFARPLNRPSRRNAVYASPTPELALMNASAALDAGDAYMACRIEFLFNPPMFQLSETDARKHPDLQNLQRVITQRLQRLGMLGMDTMMPLAALFLPGVTKAELQTSMDASPMLADLVNAASSAVRLWDCLPVPDGELFFEIAEDNHYVLRPV
ncbi:hypothetical protein [Pseudoduganella danionis]|uniref:hypothetical protein n=1 Tax=Pseudoduganella danionis TaxID=1890295 RepID=UPI0035AF7B4F